MRVVTLERLPGGGGQPLFVDFVNTLHWFEGLPIELIGNAADFSAWVAERGLPAHDLADCLPAVHVLREHVRAATEALAAGRSLLDADLAALNNALAAPVGHLVLVGADNPQLAYGTQAPDALLFTFQVALSLAVFLESGDRHRLKLCANPGCGFAFLDLSTNGTRRWCFMRFCGNRMKARAFRGRSRQRSPGPPKADYASGPGTSTSAGKIRTQNGGKPRL